MEAVRPDQTGVATGMNAVMRTIGGAIGGQVAASLLAASLLANGYPSEAGYTTTFVVMAGVLAASVAASLAVPGRRPHRAQLVTLAERTDRSNERVPSRVVVVGVDGSRESEAALRFATEEAKLRGALLRIVCGLGAVGLRLPG